MTISITMDNVSFEVPYVTGRSNLADLGRLGFITGAFFQRQTHYNQILTNISCTLNEGDIVGLVGHNGAGKTTMLRVLAGVYEPTNGSVTAKGRVTSLLSAGAGFNRNATGLENIFLRGVHLNMSRQDILARLDKIISFSELEGAIHKPLYTYSDGMRARLAFSIAVEAEQDILILDEWLGAGDPDFQDKAMQRMLKFVNSNGITVLASHNRRIIKSVCNRIIELDNGEIVRDERVSSTTELPINLKDQIKIQEKKVKKLQEQIERLKLKRDDYKVELKKKTKSVRLLKEQIEKLKDT